MKALLNGEDVFLDGGELPAIRLSSIDLTDISKVRGNTSTTIKVALTPQSRRILGDEHGARRPHAVTDNTFIITDDAGQEVYRAKCAIISATRDTVEMIAVSGNAYWIDWAKRTKIRDLILTTTDVVNYNGRMTPVVSQGISVQSNVGNGLVKETWTNNWLLHYPLIDYGALKGSNSTFRVPANIFRPGVRLWKLLEAAFMAGGYTLSANDTLKDRLSKLILITNTDSLRVLYDPDFQGMLSPTLAEGGHGCGLRQVSTSYTLTAYGATPTAVGGLSAMYDTQGNFTTGTQRFKVAEDCEMIMRIRNTKVIIPTDGSFTGKMFRLIFWDETDGYEFYGSWSTPITAADSAAGAKFITASSPMKPILKDHILFFGLQVDDLSGLSTTNVTVMQTGVGNQVCVQYVVDGLYDQFFTAFQLGVPHRVIVKNILPDLTVADIVSSTVAHQGLCMVSDETEVRMEQLDEFLGTDPLDITDWIDYTISPQKKYNQVGTVRYKWKEAEADELLNRIDRVGDAPGYGNADLKVGDGSDTRDVDLKFSATAMDNVLGGKMLPAIRKDGGAAGENNFGISTRLLYDGGVVAASVNVGTSSTYFTYSQYPFTYFVKDGHGAPMAFGDAERHWCPGFLPSTSKGVLSALHKKEVTLLAKADTLKMYVAWPKDWLRKFDFSRLFAFMDGLSTVHAYVNEIECANFENRHHLTEFVLLRPGSDVVVANPPVVFPEPPQPVVYKRCVYWVDYRPHLEISDPMEVQITSFIVDGVEQVATPIILPAAGSYIVVDGTDYWTNLIDALNAINVPNFRFDPHPRVPGEAMPGGENTKLHGQYMAITRPENADFSIVFTIGGTPYRYTPSGAQIDNGSGWEPMYDYHGYEGTPQLCETLPELPDPPTPPALRRCSYYQDFSPYIVGGYNGGWSIAYFTVDGVYRGSRLFDPVDNYVMVDGRAFYTNLIDALNALGAPWFSFAPTGHLGGNEQAMVHGGWFTVTCPANATWSFEVHTPFGLPYMRYDSNGPGGFGVFQWDGMAWQVYDNTYGDGQAKNTARNCTNL